MLRNTISYNGMAAGLGNDDFRTGTRLNRYVFMVPKHFFDLFFPSVDLSINGVPALPLLVGFYRDIAVLCAAQKSSILWII